MIAMKDRTQIKRLLQYGIAIFGKQHKTEEYFLARPSDQCKLCQQFGHHYRQCKNPTVCGICADPHHDTTTHSCLNCTSRHGCIHKPPKCANCGGKHKANSPECKIMKAIRGPQPSQGDEVPMGDANTNANTTTGA